MHQKRNKLYSLLFTACFAGYVWLFYNVGTSGTEKSSVEVCLIKNATNIPCPSCGTTRAMISLVNGDFFEALFLNPFGYIVALIMLLAPLWIVFDLISKNNSLFIFYQKIERFLVKPKLAIPLIFLVLANWIWNISKGL